MNLEPYLNLLSVLCITLFILAVLGGTVELVSRVRRVYWRRQTRLRTGAYWKTRWSA